MAVIGAACSQESASDVRIELSNPVPGLDSMGLFEASGGAVEDGVPVRDVYLHVFEPVQHEIGRLWQEMYRSQYFEGGRVLTAAISAIDVALHDVVGKALGVAVDQLLGGKQRELVPCFATTGAPDLETLVANSKLLLEKGWDVIRIGSAQRKKNDDELLFEPRETIGITASWLTELRQELVSCRRPIHLIWEKK